MQHIVAAGLAADLGENPFAAADEIVLVDPALEILADLQVL
jgi:hypothetical protein